MGAFFETQCIYILCILVAVRALTRDNITEHPSTINILSRMNVYQEVFLAAVYRLLPALHVNIILCLFSVNR